MRDRHSRRSVDRRSVSSRRTFFLGGLAAVMLVAVLPAFADAPETGSDPVVTLTVTPSDFLSDGQAVTVTGTGFTPNTPGTIRQCAGPVTAPQCDPTVTASFVTTATGDVPPTSVTVERIINTGATTFNCGVQTCALVATAGDRTSQHHIRMTGAGTSVPTSSTSTSIATVPPPGSVPPASNPPVTFTPVLPMAQLVCSILQALVEPFPFLRDLFTSLLGLFGCPPTG